MPTGGHAPFGACLTSDRRYWEVCLPSMRRITSASA